MKRRYLVTFALTLLLALLPGPPKSVAADASASGEEISYLIQCVETSGARFIRNGQEYTAREGADHLRDKWKKAGDRVKTAEDFIEGVASKSYISGKPYLVKTPDGKEHPTGPWLSDLLVKYRARKKGN